MKQLPLLLAFCLYSFASQAQQTFTLTPNPVFGDETDPFEVEGRATVKNLAATTQNFRWKRTVIRLDNDSICYTAVTDPNIHWFYTISEKSFSLDAGQEGPLYVSLFDFEASGCCAIVHMKLKKLDAPVDSIEAYYYLRTCQPLAVSEIQKFSVQLFPNPVAQYFSLKNAESVSNLTLCDASGKMLKRMQANLENHYGIADLPLGAYYLVLENKDGSIVQVLQFQKASE
ncbi:MAG: T9SS type A sorting domain-containing protein [Phycisphaerae bacterium]|nr:T9SS type A sorting domain-containing protein [Saprospiraceae bacterium]